MKGIPLNFLKLQPHTVRINTNFISNIWLPFALGDTDTVFMASYFLEIHYIQSKEILRRTHPQRTLQFLVLFCFVLFTPKFLFSLAGRYPHFSDPGKVVLLQEPQPNWNRKCQWHCLSLVKESENTPSTLVRKLDMSNWGVT